MISDFEVIPYVGAGPLRFGMTPQEVIALLGEPEVVAPTWDKRLAHGYPGLRLFYSHQNTLAECGFEPPLKLMVGGVDATNDKLALQKLAKLDPHPLRHMDVVWFPALGMTMGVRRTPNDCEVAVFVKGALDGLDFEPYSVIRAVVD